MDWRKIKREYITTDTSYRKLCEKYGVNRRTLEDRASKEGWVELRRQRRGKAVEKMIDACAAREAESARLLQATAADLLAKIAEGMSNCDPDTLLADGKALRGITGALRDLKDVLSLKGEMDLKEQEARIAKLRKEAAEEQTDNKLEVVFVGGGDVGEWSE